jgi:hypothetical protein
VEKVKSCEYFLKALLCFQHYSALHLAKDPGIEHLPLQLEPEPPNRPLPGGEGRQQHIRQADPQHGGPSGVRA